MNYLKFYYDNFFEIHRFFIGLVLITVNAQGASYKIIFNNTDLNLPESSEENTEEADSQFIPGEPYSLNFNGTSSKIDTSISNQIHQNWSIEFWAYMDDWSTSVDNNRDSIFTMQEDRTTNRPLNIDISQGLLTHYRGEAASKVMEYNAGNLTGWNHIAVTQKRVDSTTVDVTMYVNGNQVDNVSGDFENLTTNLWIGYDGTDNTKFWKGQLDNIQLWKTTRTGKQISNNYQTTIEANNSNLIGYWTVDNNNSTLVDQTGNNYDGNMTDIIIETP